MRWATYFAVLAAVLSVGLALGVSMPLVSFRLESWGYGPFAIGVMASMPAIGVLLGAKVSSRLAARFGTAGLMRLCLWGGAISIGLLALLPSYPLWLVLRLMIGVVLTIVFILGESWINQLVVERWRGRLVALYGSSYALSQLAGPLLLGALGTEHDYGFWVGVVLLVVSPLLLMGRSGAPSSESCSVTFGDLWRFCRGLPAIGWAVALFAAFEAMILTLLPVYCLRQGFTEEIALAMVSTVVVGDALLQLPIGALADRISRRALFAGCAVILLLSSLAIPLLLDTLLIWPLWVLFGASAGGLFTLSLILIGERYRDDALVRANAHVAQLWGIGCLIGPLVAGAGSQWISGHALLLLMAAGAMGLIVLLLREGAFGAVQPQAL
ncbi:MULTISPECIES: MFS transporter [Pseudomonas]|uniref:MFS-type transporter n=1 Tax=Pseudomonas chlororaphis subsp. aureofaciens TaxID=587851 RepID=A0AAD1E936_9PSED|nr:MULTISPECIES: MFS transporter [Pseudomonas]AZD89257.1 putative MFS-type transporter [Pseudomonas chlororaphis subsp. aureofaciens]AZD95717.1 putative MFS-type transporter [Pseudomonas chlororaphis subsp. aureofaciens]AZE02007.1 putative MFS-type transporter [Pseudomonas chlororaphis subsp. aureofaciens]AZE14308.1 putative MFS-type transporter [Pseudomonas chlororaphis subsp. aureofaciens]AZE20278.1 putative MFS-type transporter [Pseudomonas chlororaphis subsp. aureofaciens]